MWILLNTITEPKNKKGSEKMYKCNNCLWISHEACKNCPKNEISKNVIRKELKINDKNVKELV